MQFKQRGAWLALALTLFIVSLACQASDRVLSVALATPSPTRTRTVRPTFTPAPTDTPTPTLTPTPTVTRTATRRPTPRPTVPPPPPPPPAAPAATAFPYRFHALTYQQCVNGISPEYCGCHHSGQAYIQGAIIWKLSDPLNTRLDTRGTGEKVRLALAPDGAPVSGDVPAVGDWYTFILNSTGPTTGTFYVWVVDGSGKRISEIPPAITMNNWKEDVAGSCWAGWQHFWETY